MSALLVPEAPPEVAADLILTAEGEPHEHEQTPPEAVALGQVTPGGYWGQLPGESTELYEHLGILAYKKYGLTGDLATKHVWSRLRLTKDSAATLPDGATSESRIENFIRITKGKELIHLGGLAVSGALTAAIGVAECTPQERILLTAACSIGNIIVNAYPVMLQRYNRLRAYRVLGRIRNVKKPGNSTINLPLRPRL